MNKKLLLFSLLVIAVSSAWAQDYVRPSSQRPEPVYSKNKRFALGISLGTATPFKDLASTNIKGSFWDFHSTDSTHLQGFARTGFNFTVTASYLFNDYIGIMAMFCSNGNKFDLPAFSNTINATASTSTGAVYGEVEYFIGPCLSFTEGDRFRFTANALIGGISMGYPEMTYPVNDSITATIDFTGGTGFGYNFGASAEYTISNSAAITLNVNYLTTTIYYSGYTVTYNSPGYYPFVYNSPSYPIYMTMGMLKITAGIVFRF